MVGSSGGASRGLASRMVLHGLPLAVATAGACAFDFGGVVYDDGATATSTSSGPGGGVGATAASTGAGASGGGGGGPVACGDLECPVVECYETSCEGEQCLLAPLEPGSSCGPEGAQTCDESLDCVACAVDGDCAPPLSRCRTVACEGGACVENAIQVGEPCVGEPGVCSAGQECVGCVGPGDCASDEVCLDGTCGVPPPSCSNGVIDPGEASADCGGVCPRCGVGVPCDADAACQTNHCDGACSYCEADAACGDGTWCNGGFCAPQGADGVPCTSGVQCTSGSCVDEVCCNDPCNGTCSSCRATDTGLADGRCGAILVGADPDFECVEGECLTGACDGAGQCGIAAGECTSQCVVVGNGTVAYEYPGVCMGGGCSHQIFTQCPSPKCNAEGTACLE